VVFDCPSSAGSIRYRSCQHEMVSLVASYQNDERSVRQTRQIGQAGRERHQGIGTLHSSTATTYGSVFAYAKKSSARALQTADAVGDNDWSRRFSEPSPVTTLGPEGPSFCSRERLLPASGRQIGSIHRPSPEVLRLPIFRIFLDAFTSASKMLPQKRNRTG
jgi:hypothetical protein